MQRCFPSPTGAAGCRTACAPSRASGPSKCRAAPSAGRAIARPWSPVPWQLLVLMEEAVTRGLAAFSEDEARRRGVAWLDLARDRKLGDALSGIAEGFERRAYVPEPLRGLVSVEQARPRGAGPPRL